MFSFHYANTNIIHFMHELFFSTMFSPFTFFAPRHKAQSFDQNLHIQFSTNLLFMFKINHYHSFHFIIDKVLREKKFLEKKSSQTKK